MNAGELSTYIKNQAKKVHEASTTSHLSFSVGFAIPIPGNTTLEDMQTVDKELRSLMHSFERIRVRGKEYYILFPFG